MELPDCSVDEILSVLKDLDDENLDLEENQKASNSPVTKGKKRIRQPKPQHDEAAVSKKKAKRKTAAPKKSLKDVMMTLNCSHNLGTWVQCSSCGKWRYLKDVQESLSLSFQNDWMCSMNGDITRNSCDAPEDAFPDKEYAEIKFAPGSLVRARLSGFPWWPAIVEYDPDEKKYAWFASVDSGVPSHYHVTFLGEPVTRSWIRCSEVRPYNELETENTKKLSEKMSRWLHEAEIQAEEALPLSLKDRIQKFSFAKRFKGRWRRPSNKLSCQSTCDNSDSSESNSHKRKYKMQRMGRDEKKLIEMIQDLDSFSSFDTDAFSESDDQDVPDYSETKESLLEEDCTFFEDKPYKKRIKNNTKSRPEKFSITMSNEDGLESVSCNSGKSDLMEIPKERKSMLKKEGSFAPPLKVQRREEIAKEKSKTGISKKNKTKKCATLETVAEDSSKSTDFRQKITGNKTQFSIKKQDGKPPIDSATKTSPILKHKKIKKLKNSDPQAPKSNAKSNKKVKELKDVPVSSYDDSIESVVQNWRCFLNDESRPRHKDNGFSPEASNKCVESVISGNGDFCNEGNSNDIPPPHDAQQPSEATVFPPVTDETCEMRMENTESESKALKKNCFSEFLEKKKSRLVSLINIDPDLEVPPRGLNDTNICVEEGPEAANDSLDDEEYRDEANEDGLLDSSAKTDETISGGVSLTQDENETIGEVVTLNNKNDDSDRKEESKTEVFPEEDPEGALNNKNDDSDRKEESKTEAVPKKGIDKKSHCKQKKDKVRDKEDKQKGKRKFYVPPIRKD